MNQVFMNGNPISPLLSSQLMKRLESFQLTASRQARSLLKGERRSRARGQSVEFADYRNYVVGDDLRYLDWNLYGRLDRLFVKLYEEERELPVAIFLDLSESMSFGNPSKAFLAKQIAGAFGYLGLCGFDRVSVFSFPEHAEEGMARRGLLRVRGKKSATRFLGLLRDLKVEGAVDLNVAIPRKLQELKQTGVALVCGDFLDPNGYEAALGSLVSRGFLVLAIQILDEEEWNPTAYGDLRLVDSESGEFQEVTFGKHRLKQYQEMVMRYQQRLKEFCAKRGIHFFSARSHHRVEDVLLKDMRRSGLIS